MNYAKYIQSEQWQALRTVVLRRDKYTCQGCGKPHCLDVHHKTYNRLGDEELTDLETLCRRCHKDTHYESSFKPASENMILQITPATEEEYEKTKDATEKIVLEGKAKR